MCAVVLQSWPCILFPSSKVYHLLLPSSCKANHDLQFNLFARVRGGNKFMSPTRPRPLEMPSSSCKWCSVLLQEHFGPLDVLFSGCEILLSTRVLGLHTF